MNRRSFFKSIAAVIIAPTISKLPLQKAAGPIVGFKGLHYLNAGVVYAPYIPFCSTLNVPLYTAKGFESNINKNYYKTEVIKI
jgi:hypothetical protein